MGFLGQASGTGLGAWRPKVITGRISALVAILVDAMYIQDQDSAAKLDIVTLGALNLMPVAVYDAAGNQTGLAANPLRVDPTGDTTQTVDGTVVVTATDLDIRALDYTTDNVELKDTEGHILEFRRENENWSASDTGILMFGRDTEGVPNKFRAIALDASGHLIIKATNEADDGFEFNTVDFDTGGGEDLISIVGIALPGSGAAVIGGTAANPLRIDPTGTTTQTVDGTVTANAGTNLNTSALLTTTNFNTRIGEVQATPTANTVLSRLKTIADNQLAAGHDVTIDNANIAVTGTFYQGTQPVSIATAPALVTSTAIIGAVKRDIVNYTKVWKYVALSGTGETTIWDPTGGKKFVVTDIIVSAAAEGTCTLRDGTAGSTIFIASLAEFGGFSTNFQTPVQSATADNILTAQASVATQYVFVSGYEV